ANAAGIALSVTAHLSLRASAGTAGQSPDFPQHRAGAGVVFVTSIHSGHAHKLDYSRYEPALILTLIRREAEQPPPGQVAGLNRLWALVAPGGPGLIPGGFPLQLPYSES